MTIFGKKFTPKVAPPRTQRLNIGCSPLEEDLDDFRSIQLNLIDKQLCFVDGVWMSTVKAGTAGTMLAAGTADDLLKMKRRVKTLEQENNLYQVKMDVLLDLLTENQIELDGARNQ